MAWGTTTAIGGGNSKVADTSIAVTLTNPVAVGDCIFVGFSGDNIQTTDGASNDVASVVDSKGHTYYKIAEWTNGGGGSAGAGITSALFIAQATVAMTTSDTYTISYGSRTAKAVVGMKITLGTSLASTWALRDVQTGVVNASTTAPSLTSATFAAREHLFISVDSIEQVGTDTYTLDSDFASSQQRGTSAGLGDSNASVRMQKDIASVASVTAQASTLTASDWASIVVTFDEVDMPVTTGFASGPAHPLFMFRRTGPMGLRLHTRLLDQPVASPVVVYSAPVSNNFEGGVASQPITPANSGGASGDAFSVVQQGTNGVTFDTTHPGHGTLSAKLQTGNGYVGYLLSPTADAYGRCYFLCDNLSGSGGIVSGSLGGAFQWFIDYSAGVPRIDRGGGGLDTAFSTTLSINTLYRFEFHHNSASQLEVRLYLGDSTTALEIVTASSLTNSTIDEIRFRNSGAGSVWLDDLMANQVTWPGSAVPDVTIIAPVATATAVALTPVLLATVLPAVSTATAQALTPNLLATVLPAAATATAAALTPVLKVTVLPAAATATAGALTPTLLVTILPAAATATAQALVPVIIVPVTILPPAATATAQALVPTIKATVLPAAAVATAQALVPIIMVTILPAAATATAQALVPALNIPIVISAPIATATAAALTPTVMITVKPAVATATAAALVPVIKVTILPGSATATATALVPIITGPSAVGLTVINGQISHELRTPGLLGQLHGQLRNVLAVSTVRGYYTFSTSYATGGETPTINIQRVVVQVLFAKLAGGKGITWNGTKIQAWNLDGSGNITTEVAAATNLSAVTVPMIVYVIAH